ncbi:hypothetical protein T484DRAFT_1912867, partial [Baffinella frigidus]
MASIPFVPGRGRPTKKPFPPPTSGKPSGFPPPTSGKPSGPLMPIRCPLPNHSASGVPLVFGMGAAADNQLKQRLVDNLVLGQVSKSGIDKIAEEACGPSVERVERPKKPAEQQSAPERPRRAPSQSAPPAGAEDMSLVTAMAGRLRHAEEASKALRDELRQKGAEIAKLKAQLAASRSAGAETPRPQEAPGAAGLKAGESSPQKPEEKLARMKEMLRRADERNRALEADNVEMRKFLKDYGLTWVGTDEDGAPLVKPEEVLKPAGMWQPGVAQGAPAADVPQEEASGPPEELDPAKVLSNVKKLNFVAGEGEKEVAVGPDGIRRFKEKALVSYVFYSDGVFARGGPLRSWALPDTKVLVRDLMDGYFPWELKDDYPDGVPLRVEMRLQEAHGGAGSAGADPSFTPFGGEGMALGREGAPAAGGVAGVSHANAKEVFQPAAGRSKGETLFRKLPNSVIGKNGEIIPIKDDIRQMIHGKEDAASAAPRAGGEAAAAAAA